MMNFITHLFGEYEPIYTEHGYLTNWGYILDAFFVFLAAILVFSFLKMLVRSIFDR